MHEDDDVCVIQPTAKKNVEKRRWREMRKRNSEKGIREQLKEG